MQVPAAAGVQLSPPAAVYLSYVNRPFPPTIPACSLSPGDIKNPYGISKDAEPRQLAQDISAYKKWCGVPVNTERGPAYILSAQSSTLETVGKKVRGFMGYVADRFHVPRDKLSLSAYQDPEKIVHFVSYLMARGAQVS